MISTPLNVTGFAPKLGIFILSLNLYWYCRVFKDRVEIILRSNLLSVLLSRDRYNRQIPTLGLSNTEPMSENMKNYNDRF